MFHVKQLKLRSLHELLFYVFLFLIPIQTRILYKPEVAHIDWYFNYHLAFFFYLTDILLITIFVSWLLFDPPHISSRPSFFWLILAFFSIISLSLFHVKHFDLGLYQFAKWGEMFLLLCYVSTVFRSSEQFYLATLIILISGIFQAILGIIQFHVQHSLNLDFFGEYIAPLGTAGLSTITIASGKLIRAYGTFPHPNVYGTFLVAALICCLYYVSRGTNMNKLAVSGGLFVIQLGIFVSFSRLAWMGSAIAIVAFCVYYWFQKQRFIIASILIVTAVSCATIGIFWHSALQARVSDSSMTSVNDRWFFGKLGLDLIKKNPILGVGVGNYVPALRDLNPNLQPWQYQPAHNIFIFLASELGILGVAALLWLLFEILRKIKNIFSDPLLFTVYCLLITFLALGLFDHYFVTIQQGRLVFFTVLGLVAALPNLKMSNDQYPITNKISNDQGSD